MTITLKEHNDNKLKEQSCTPLTNIKCEKCDGIYRHVDVFTVYTSQPPQKLVSCNVCGDKQYIIA